MNCDQFQLRLNRLLDHREEVQNDEAICRHARECDDCRDRLQVWNVIHDSAVFDHPKLTPSAISATESPASRLSYKPALAVAAAILVLVSVASWSRDSAPTGTPKLASNEPSLPTHVMPHDQQDEEAPSTLNSANWWKVVSEEQWVGRTMPAVDSVRLGVAPIGRSMKQAFALLMIDSFPAPLTVPPLSPESPTDPLKEQASSLGLTRQFSAMA